MSIIRIKRSGTTGAPSELATGEFAYSYLAGDLTNGGDRLFIGTGTQTNGVAENIEVIGGKYFTQKLDHTPGTLTANSALIVDSNSKIDRIFIDNLSLDGNTITTTNLNGNLVLSANGAGVVDIQSDLSLTGNVDISAQLTVGSLNVEDLTDNRIVIAGASGEIEDDANFTFDGTTFDIGQGKLTTTVATGATYIASTLTVDDDFAVTANGSSDAVFTVDAETGDTVVEGTTTLRGNLSIGANNEFTVSASDGNTQIKGTIDVDGQATLASLNVEDLTATRVTFAGTNGELEDSANLTFNSGTSTLTLTGTYNQTGSATIDGDLTVDKVNINGNVISTIDTNQNLVLTPHGSGHVKISGTNGLVIPVGTTAQQGPAVDGAIRLNSTSGQFEGYSNSNWSSLGGVRSVDGLTYIIAEDSPGNSDDTLHFFVATSNTTNTEVATLDELGLAITATTQSTSTTTGSIVTAGGVGIAKDVNIGGNVDVDGDVNVDGGDITTNLTSFNLLNTNATTVNAFGAATEVNIGASGEGTGLTTINHDLLSVGDFYVASNTTPVFVVDASTGDTEIARHLVVQGDLTVNGNTTTINVSTIEVEDAMIRLAANNDSDSVDIGVVGNYTQIEGNTVTDMITGIFRDSTSGEWYLFDEYVDGDIDDNIIDTSSPTFSRGILNTDAVKFSETTIELTGDVVGTIDISQFGGGDDDANTATTHTISTTIQPNSVALGTDTTGAYVSTITSDTATGIQVTGSGAEIATVTIAGVLADTAGQVGVATYDATNFDVSNTGVVTVDTIDGGTY